MMLKIPMLPSFHFEVNCEVHHAISLGDLIRPAYWTLGHVCGRGLSASPASAKDCIRRRQAISPGIPPGLLPLTARARVRLDRPGSRFLKLSLGDILDGGIADLRAFRRSAGGSRGRRRFLIRRGHTRRRLLAPHCASPFGMTPAKEGGSPTSQMSWWSWAAILMNRSRFQGEHGVRPPVPPDRNASDARLNVDQGPLGGPEAIG